MDSEKEELLEVYNGNAEKTGKVVVRGTVCKKANTPFPYICSSIIKAGSSFCRSAPKLKKTHSRYLERHRGAVAAGEDSVTAGTGRLWRN